MSDIKDLTQLILRFRDARNWKQFHKPKDMFISLALEAAELLEESQWKDNQEILSDLRDRPENIANELADVFYWVLLIAHDLNIDLEEALQNKLKKNEAKYPVNKARNNSRL